MLRFLLLLPLLLLPLATPASAQERITSFSSDITIQQNGTLSVTERISVVSLGFVIQRGIFRDFPTDYIDRFGRRVRVGFEVTGVTRNGNPEPYVVEAIGNGQRVRIGDADVFLDDGPHSYTITYTTNRQIGFFDDHDELYWNVNGLGWEFPAESVEATVRLEGGAIEGFEFYTGAYGENGKDAVAQRLSPDTVHYRTTRTLSPGEGLTVVATFAKGIVMPPTAEEEMQEFLGANMAAGAALFGLIVLFGYYFTMWLKVGRDPARGVIIPLFTPPEGFSPAATRFVYRMGYDRKAFAAALISMAVKGYLTVSEEGSTYTLTRTGRSEDETGLAKGERAIAGALFSGGSEIELKNSNHARVSKAITALKEKLQAEDEGVYFVTNGGWFYGGLIILFLSAVLTVLLSDSPAESGFILIWLSIWSTGTSFLVYRVLQLWQGVLVGPGNRILNTGAALFHTLFAVPFVGGLIGALVFLGHLLPMLATVALVVQGILAFVFYRLLKAPTKAGAKVRDEIEGFLRFLVTTEKDRLEVLHPPNVTPEMFEKYLPYAIALDAENAWSRKFEAEIAEAGATTQTTAYAPRWYSGHSFSRLGTAGFASAIGGAVAGATAAAATAPGRSSGSGGGGFSGGGGGGGGGW
jgi:hypothetical protein